MCPTLSIAGFKIASYGVLVFLGILAALSVALILGKQRGLKTEDTLFAVTYAVLGTLIGGKIHYLLIELPSLIRSRALLTPDSNLLRELLVGGFVFYGGLCGAVLAVFIYCKLYKVSLSDMFAIIITVLPLAHVFGRTACFAAGCCYGITYSGACSVVFSSSLVAPNGTPLFPVQLLEAVLNLLIFITLLVSLRKKPTGQQQLALYLFLYAVMRFCLEFLRGDRLRGFFLGFSTSQWISVLIIIIISVRQILLRKNEKR